MISNPIKMKGLGESVEMNEDIRCLNCNEKLDEASPVGDMAYPAEGDISMCAYCGHLATFDADHMLRDLTDEEMDEATAHPDVQAVIEARRKCMT